MKRTKKINVIAIIVVIAIALTSVTYLTSANALIPSEKSPVLTEDSARKNMNSYFYALSRAYENEIINLYLDEFDLDTDLIQEKYINLLEEKAKELEGMAPESGYTDEGWKYLLSWLWRADSGSEWQRITKESLEIVKTLELDKSPLAIDWENHSYFQSAEDVEQALNSLNLLAYGGYDVSSDIIEASKLAYDQIENIQQEIRVQNEKQCKEHENLIRDRMVKYFYSLASAMSLDIRTSTHPDSAKEKYKDLLENMSDELVKSNFKEGIPLSRNGWEYLLRWLWQSEKYSEFTRIYKEALTQ